MISRCVGAAGVALSALLLTGCGLWGGGDSIARASPSSSHTRQGAGTSPSPSLPQSTGVPGVAPGLIDIAQVPEDRTAGGSLVDTSLPASAPTLPIGEYVWTDPFGNLWWGGDTGAVVVRPDTGEVRKFGGALLVGQAAAGANGTVGERVLAADGTAVWQARDETGVLELDSYDIFAWAPGGEPLKIGESTEDWDGQKFSAPGDGNYLTAIDGHAYWVDGMARQDERVDGGYSRYSSILVAPLDGSSSQRVLIGGARFPQVDQCAPDDVNRLTYLVDPMSTGSEDTVASVHAAVLGEDGSVISDEVIWRDDQSDGWIDSVGVCGDSYAIGYTDGFDDNDASIPFVEVTTPEVSSTVALHASMASGAGRVTVTEDGVFFFLWGGLEPAQVVMWSREQNSWWKLGVGATWNIAATDSGLVTFSEQLGPWPEDGSWPPYGPRIVSFAGG